MAGWHGPCEPMSEPRRPSPAPGEERPLLRSDGERGPWVDRDPQALELWFPRYFLREIVALLIVLAGLSVLSLFLDAPLLAIADPSATPDPSKAPWYFVGLQELLHYYPPFVAGALVPGAAVLSLMAMPYLGRPTRRTPLWQADTPRGRRLAQISAAVLIAVVTMVLPAAHTPWVLVVPTLAVALAAASPALLGTRGGPGRWLAARTVRGWIMTWAVSLAVVLSITGGLFRGPGWRWVWPWVDGIF